MELKAGSRFSWQRRITEEDIRLFTEVSQDQGRHHVSKDSAGRLLAQGLLAATMPTKLGGDLNFIARRMEFDFLGPVYAGDALTCVGTVDLAIRKQGRLKVKFSFEVTNQEQKLVVKGNSHGIILDAQ
jgi:acyl dehydratase